MATKIAVEIVGDSASLERSFARSGASAKVFAKEVGTAARGSAAASGAFKSMGRSIAFASGGFLAFGAAVGAIKASISAAQQAEVTQRQLATTIRASGSSIGSWQKGIDSAGLSLAKFGFTTDNSQAALNTLVRSTGSVEKALSVLGVAANIARAKNLDLNAAALLVGKAVDGQTTGLRRLGVELPKTAKGMDLIRDAGKAFAGQAAASTTEGEKFHATLHDTEVIIGTALLPTFNHLLDSLGKWLQNMNQSGRLQRDVNQAVNDFTAAARAAKAILDPLVAAFKALGGAVGGTKNEVELLIGAFAVFKAASFLNGLDAVSGAVAGIGTKAVVAEGEVGGLNTQLGLLARNPALAILALGGADLFLGHKALTTQAAAGDVIGSRGSPYVKGSEQNDLYQAGLSGKTGMLNVGGGTINVNQMSAQERAAYFAGLRARLSGQTSAIGKQIVGAVRGGSSSSSAVTAGNGALTAHQQLTNALIANPNNLTLLAQQVAYDKSALASAAKQRADGRITNARYQQEYANYMGDLVSTEQTITSITQAGAKKVAAEQKKQLAAMRVVLPASIGGSYTQAPHRISVPKHITGSYAGTSGYSIPMALQLASAKDTALGDQGGLMSVAQAEKAAALRALKSGRLAIQGQIDAWNVIDQANQTLGTSMAQGAKVVSSRALTAGLNLTRMQRIALEARYSTAAAFSGHTPTSMGVLGQSVNITHLHLHGVQDVHGLSDALSKLSRGKGAPQTVGPNAGRTRAQ